MRTRSRIAVVDEMLRVLVNEWGYDVVLQCLKNVERLPLSALDAKPSGPALGQHRTANVSGEARDRMPRPSAVACVSRMGVPDEKREFLLALASRFEKRRFLPTIGDVRNFLEINHAPVGNLNKREAAIPKVFRVLLTLPDERLDKILREDGYSGPSQLGPLSDAIKASSAAIRSTRQTLDLVDSTGDKTDATDG